MVFSRFGVKPAVFPLTTERSEGGRNPNAGAAQRRARKWKNFIDSLFCGCYSLNNVNVILSGISRGPQECPVTVPLFRSLLAHSGAQNPAHPKEQPPGLEVRVHICPMFSL